MLTGLAANWRYALQTKIKKAPSEYLRQVWLDVVAPIAMAIHYAYDFVGRDRLLYSSDQLSIPTIQSEADSARTGE